MAYNKSRIKAKPIKTLNKSHATLSYPQLITKPQKRSISYSKVKIAVNDPLKPKKRILLVLDYVPTEDLRSNKLLSGATGVLLERILGLSNNFFKSKEHLNDNRWVAIAYNMFKTAHMSDSEKAIANDDFKNRLEKTIIDFKPDNVITFGISPLLALNKRKVAQIQYNVHNLYGVPIDTKFYVDSDSNNCSKDNQDRVIRFKHIPTISLNTLVNDNGSGSEMALSGYVARNIHNGISGKLRYKISDDEFDTVFVDTISKFDKMLDIINRADFVAIDTETENLNRRVNKMLTIQFACTDTTAYVVPIYHKDNSWLPKELKVILRKLSNYFEYRNKNKLHVYVNGVFDLNVIRNNCGVRFFKNSVWDIFAGEYCLDENLKFLISVTGNWYYSLLNISMQYGSEAYYIANFGKDRRKTIVNADLDADLLEYCALDVIIPMRLFFQQLKKAKDIGYSKYKSIVGNQISDMIHAFSTFEHNGAYVDIVHLFSLNEPGTPIRDELDKVLKALKESKGAVKVASQLNKDDGVPPVGLWGRSNINNFDPTKDQHLQRLFFGVLKLKVLSYGKEQNQPKAIREARQLALSTNKPTNDVPGAVYNDTTFKVKYPTISKKFQKKNKSVEEVSLFARLQAVRKLHNSYVTSWIKQWGTDEDMRFDQRIRPHFEFLPVVTGRSSAKKPSLHQIPNRSALGKEIKKLLISEHGRLLVKVDYSAHEVRCFSLESFVLTEVGMIKLKVLIEMIHRPKVYSFNHSKRQVELKEIGNVSVHTTNEDMYEIGYTGGTLTVTGNHKIWSKTRNEYVRTDSAEDGEELLIISNIILQHTTNTRVQYIKKVSRPSKVCDIGVEDNHNLFVCDNVNDKPILAHNCWSIFTFDDLIAAAFEKGRKLRNKFKIYPEKELGERVALEGDVHKVNASYFFGVPIHKVTKDIRDAVKSVVFGLIYQQGDKGLSESTGQTLEAIKDLADRFRKRYPIGIGWFDKVKTEAVENHCVESPLGRRRHTWGLIVPETARNGDQCYARTTRQSVNSPIQGMGSDFLINGARCVEKLKYDYYRKSLKSEGKTHYPDFYQANSVHDSITFSVAYEDFWLAISMIEDGLTTEVAKVAKERHNMDFVVPLEIDFEIGKCEGTATPWSFSLKQLRSIIKKTLDAKQEQIDKDDDPNIKDIDKKAILKDIMFRQYKHMPTWAKKQFWNLGFKKSKARDPRNKSEVLDIDYKEAV